MTGGRTDKDLMLADSQTAAVNYGFHSGSFNVPKSKFLFYVQFVRDASSAVTATTTNDTQDGIATSSKVTQAQSNSTQIGDWERDIGLACKSVDRPRTQFKTETLNQYNRKRIVQTGHELEPVTFKFHDTVKDSLNSMFLSYYQYYYGDSAIGTAGTSIYDIVSPGAMSGHWGFNPLMAANAYNYYFTHVSVYQLFNGEVTQFDLVNPKIVSYNPDDMDHSAGNMTNEITMSVAYEQIIYHPAAKIPASLLTSMGLDQGNYWDVQDSTANLTYSTAKGSPAGSIGNAIGGVLKQNLASLVTGQGTQGLKGAALSVASQFDANRGIAVGSVGISSIKDLVSGNTASGTQGIQGLLKGGLFGSPGKFF